MSNTRLLYNIRLYLLNIHSLYIGMYCIPFRSTNYKIYTYNAELNGVGLRWLGWDLALIDSRIPLLKTQFLTVRCILSMA
jgi:hypothetical protein